MFILLDIRFFTSLHACNGAVVAPTKRVAISFRGRFVSSRARFIANLPRKGDAAGAACSFMSAMRTSKCSPHAAEICSIVTECRLLPAKIL